MKKLLLSCLLISMAAGARAQFMRVGPVDFFASAYARAIYSTNADRDFSQDGREEDFWVVTGLRLNAVANVIRNTTISLDSDIWYEKHFIRDDLDRTGDPFGNLKLTTQTALGPYNVGLGANYRRTWRLDNDRFDPEGRRVRTRQTSYGYDGSISWSRNALSWDAFYNKQFTEYDEFERDDTESESFGFNTRWDLIQWGGVPRAAPYYRYRRSRSGFKNEPSRDRDWGDFHEAGVSVLVWQRPRLQYGLALVKDERGRDASGDWRLTHTVSADQTWDITPTVSASVFANWRSSENRVDEDTTSFRFGGSLDHAISRVMRHRAYVNVEPVETLGSDNLTERVTYGYRIERDHLFIQDLRASADLAYDESKFKGDGVGAPAADEDRFTARASLSHSRMIAKDLARTLAYEFYYSEISRRDDDVVDHRFTVGLEYTF